MIAPPLFVSRKYCAIAAGNSSVATTANGASRAEPLAISAHPSGVPTMVSAAAAGMCAALGAAGDVNGVNHRRDVAPRSRRRAAPVAREAICADAQIGAPAQATTCRRGSSARTIKPSCSAASTKADAAAAVSPIDHQRAVRRCTHADRASAARGFSNRSSDAGIGVAEGETDAARKRSIAQPVRSDWVTALRYGIGPCAALRPRSGGRRCAERNGAPPSAARISRARAGRPRRAMTSSKPDAASTP